MLAKEVVEWKEFAELPADSRSQKLSCRLIGLLLLMLEKLVLALL